MVAASPAYFETLRSSLLQGGAFESGDRPETPAVLLVSSGFAAAAWPGEDPLGRQLEVAGEIRPVVGIVKQDAFLDATLGGERVMYLPYAQNTSPVFVGLARTSVDPGGLAEDLRRAIAGVDRGIATSSVRPLPEMLAEFRVGLDAISPLLVGFGLLALGLAGSGIYGVTRYSVSRRTREFGVRAAFGASPRLLLRLVMREAATLAGLGFLIGAPFMVLMVVFVRNLLTGFALPAHHAARVPPKSSAPGLAAGGGTRVSADSGQFSRWGLQIGIAAASRETPRVLHPHHLDPGGDGETNPAPANSHCRSFANGTGRPSPPQI